MLDTNQRSLDRETKHLAAKDKRIRERAYFMWLAEADPRGVTWSTGSEHLLISRRRTGPALGTSGRASPTCTAEDDVHDASIRHREGEFASGILT